jgi:thymidylate synthase
MRIFKDCLDMIQEVNRDLLVQGISVPVKHYQNKSLFGEDQLTKELVGVSFLISKPLKKREEMVKFLFKEDYKRILEYCEQEFKDRISETPLNPGNSYLIRQDMWQKFIVGEENKFDYTYSERLYWQFENIIQNLKEDIHSRQAFIQIFQSNIDNNKLGGDSRIPCSTDYQFLIRNNRLYCIYHMRSSDYFGHFPIDIYLSTRLMEYLIDRLKEFYPELKIGSLIFFAGSFHAYNWDLKKVSVY